MVCNYLPNPLIIHNIRLLDQFNGITCIEFSSVHSMRFWPQYCLLRPISEIVYYRTVGSLDKKPRFFHLFFLLLQKMSSVTNKGL